MFVLGIGVTAAFHIKIHCKKSFKKLLPESEEAPT